MKAINIYDLPRFDKTIYFIEESPKGKLYSNQTNGCACNHPSLRGILHKFAVNDKSLDSFNPDWWYNKVHREGGLLDSKIASQVTYRGISWGNSFDLYGDSQTDRSKLPKKKDGEDFSAWMDRENRWLEEHYPAYKRANKIFNKIEKMVSEHPKLITWKKLAAKVEKDINKVKPKRVCFVIITAPFGYRPGGSENGSEEAWVRVQVMYNNGKLANGVITWENCD